MQSPDDRKSPRTGRPPGTGHPPANYQLIDFGGGRKLESLGEYRIDRPSPAAKGVAKATPGNWSSPDARFDASKKRWQIQRPWPDDLVIDCGPFRMPVQPTPFGHIGLFPEQADNWQWLAVAPEGSNAAGEAQPEALNLFAYTGASTMALVAAGYRVAHVDAAKPNVQAAREAAAVNGWSDPPIRFLVDDAAKFTAREVRRRRSYHTIVLDPPAYGHSPKGKAWRLERDLWPLLDVCLELLNAGQFRLLITGHSPNIGSDEVVRYLQRNKRLADARPAAALRIEAGRSQLRDPHDRPLDAGFFVRVESP